MKKPLYIMLYIILNLLVAAIFALALIGAGHADQTTQASSTQSGAVIIQDFGHNAATPAADFSRAVGNAYAPAIPASLVTCQGGVSAAAGFAGGAFSLGRSIESDPCNLRQNAMAVLNCKGDASCLAIMCNDPIVKSSLLLTDSPCPQSNPKLNAAKIKANSQARQLALQAQFDKRYGVTK